MEMKVQKFLVIPILSTYNDEGELIREDRLKNCVIFAARSMDLKKLSEVIQERVNAEKYKVEKTAQRGHRRDKDTGKDVVLSGQVQVSSDSRGKKRRDNNVRSNKTHSRIRSLRK